MPAGTPKRQPGLRILVADDNRDTVESMARLISLWGYQVRPAFTHQEAITTCQDFRPDVLLLDLGFPLRTDGLHVARTVRAQRPEERFVIAAVTGHQDEFTRSEAARAGIDHFFVKPVAPEALRAFLAGLPAGRAATP